PVVADFGIALAISTAGGSRLTDTGMSVGTPHYMSPEQASADRGMDARSDLYSLACVLYEMLAGDPPHAGSTARAVLMRILTEEPRDVTDARSSVPAHVRDALRKAMEKLPADRFTTAAEFGEALQNPAFRHGSVSDPDRESGGGRERAARRWIGRTAAATLFIMGVALGAWRPWERTPVTRLTIALPPGQAVTSAPAVSPDGRTVAYTAGLASEPPRLFLRDLDDFEPEEVPDSEGAEYPFFSPDGRSVAFFARGRLFRWDRGGGPPRALAEAPTQPQGGTWGDDGTIVFVPIWNGGLVQIPASGAPGDAERLLVPQADSAYSLTFPRWVPGTREITYSSVGQGGLALRSIDMDTGERTLLQTGASSGWVTKSGRLLFATGDLTNLQYRSGANGGDADMAVTSVLTGVHRRVWFTEAWIGLSPTGTLAYVPADMNQRTLVRVDLEGRATPLSEIRDQYGSVRVSPGGDSLVANAFVYLWLYGPDGGRAPLAPETGDWQHSTAVWDGTGSRVVFSSNEPGNWDLFERTVGAPANEVRVQKEFDQEVEAVSPDGTLAFVETHPETGRDLWLVPVGGSPTAWQATDASEGSADFSPDGRWLAYTSNVTGRAEVWVGSVEEDSGRRTQVTTDGGDAPVWSPSGDRLYYRRGSAMMAVEVADLATLRFGAHRTLFDGGWALPGPEASQSHTYHVMPDGEHLVMIRHEPTAIPDRIHVVLDWLEELEAGSTP
ncbi:MAG: PD40 domain-containing protein, partial [Gemmatimonadales bacterium]